MNPSCKEVVKKISYIVPSYNAETTLRRCLESVLNQVLPEGISSEVIVVDNASSDRTFEIASSLPCAVYSYEKERSAAAARNFGVSKASGEYIAFIDSDVVLAKSWTLNILKPMMALQIEIGQGPVYPVMDQRCFLRSFRYIHRNKETNGKFYFHGNRPIINTAACIIKSQELGEHPFDIQLRKYEDSDLTESFYRKRATFFFTKKAKAVCYFNEGLYSYIKRYLVIGFYKQLSSHSWGNTHRFSDFLNSFYLYLSRVRSKTLIYDAFSLVIFCVTWIGVLSALKRTVTVKKIKDSPIKNPKLKFQVGPVVSGLDPSVFLVCQDFEINFINHQKNKMIQMKAPGTYFFINLWKQALKGVVEDKFINQNSKYGRILNELKSHKIILTLGPSL